MAKNKGGAEAAGVKKDRSKIWLFTRTFLLSTITVLVLSLVGLLVYGSIKIAPPTLNDETPPDWRDGYYDEDGNWHAVASLPPEMNEADRNIGTIHDSTGNREKGDRKELCYTFLIIGLDNGINTDTIMVASYDGVAKEANIISIPRDTLVNVQRPTKKINAAYGAGTLNGGGHEGGVEQLKREISTLIGFAPDFYVCIDLKAFERIIDAVEGIDVYVPYNMIYDDPFQNLHINIPKGQQHLKGSEAIKFARHRQNNDGTQFGDYRRIENQQAVIDAVLEKLLHPSILLKVPEFIQIFQETVRTDIKIENMLWFAAELNEIRGTDALSMHTLRGEGGTLGGRWYERIDPEATRILVNNTINPYTFDLPPENFNIITTLP